MEKVPDNYIVVDTETNGPPNSEVRVIQLGWCVVTNRVLTSSGYTNLYSEGMTMTEKAQSIHGLSLDHLRETGSDPSLIFSTFRDTLQVFVEDGGYALVGQNLVGFDAGVLMAEFDRHHCKNFVFNAVPIVDVGVSYKAYQLSNVRAYGESFWSYYRRIQSIRAKDVKWNIKYCMEMFNVESDPKQLHNAEFDCICVQMLLEKMREHGIIESVLWPGRDTDGRAATSARTGASATFRPGGGI